MPDTNLSSDALAVLRFTPDLVHDRSDDLVQSIGEALLVDVVLIEAHADGLGVDFHELGEGILETAPDGDGAPDREVELGELVASDVARRVHRGAVLVDDRKLAVETASADGRRDDLLGLVARRAVAHGDELQTRACVPIRLSPSWPPSASRSWKYQK